MNPPQVAANRKDIEAIQPLSPVQSALLFASLRAGAPSDPGLIQLRCTLEGEIIESVFEAAWRHVIARHASLRASVHWQNVDRPLQVVLRTVEPSWLVEDLRDLPQPARVARLQAYLETDRSRGLDLSRAPVLRLARFRVAEDEWRLVWSCHHVLLDGWSAAIVLSEVAAAYAALRRGGAPSLPAVRPYRDYIQWLQRQDASESEVFWRGALTGLRTPTLLPFADAETSERGGSGFTEQKATLTVEATQDVTEFARQNQVTVGTLVHAAWALLLGASTGRQDVCFGTTVSGRGVPVPGIDSMVGLFTSALPVRVSLEHGLPIRDFLKSLQIQLAGLRVHGHISPGQIQGWSEIPGHQRLFDSLVVFENFPAGVGGEQSAGAMRLHSLQGGITTTYPATLVVTPGAGLALALAHDRAVLNEASARQSLDALTGLIRALVEDPDRRLSELEVTALASGPRIRRNSGTAATVAPIPEGLAADPSAVHDREGRRPDPPRDDLELQLVHIWEDVLKVQPVGVRDDFFALGGHSLNAAQLFDRIERVLGKRLPLATLFEVPTVELLARRFRDRHWTPPWSALVPLQREGSGPPVFLVHSYEGHLLFYRELARALPPDQPLYGLQSVGLDGTRPPLATVEAMATHYLNEIRAVQPAGPYRLVGMCFGIAVVFEMAQQLLAGGATVEPIILDSGFFTRRPAPVPTISRRTVPRRILDRSRAHARRLRARSRRVFRLITETERERIARRVREANEAAFFAYVARRYPGQLTLVRSEEYSARLEWHLATWSELVATLETQVVPGGHLSMLQEPFVRRVADLVRARVDA